jgi:hypothetical protein
MREITLACWFKNSPPIKLSLPEAEAWYADYKRLGGKGSERDFIAEMETFTQWKSRHRYFDDPPYTSYVFNNPRNPPKKGQSVWAESPPRPEQDIFDFLCHFHSDINDLQVFGKLVGLI